MADLALLHGKILTMDPARPEVAALAASGDRIIAVGTDDEIKGHIGGHTRVIDLGGTWRSPGLSTVTVTI